MDGAPHAAFFIAEMRIQPLDLTHEFALCIGDDTAHTAGRLNLDDTCDLHVTDLPDFSHHLRVLPEPLFRLLASDVEAR